MRWCVMVSGLHLKRSPLLRNRMNRDLLPCKVRLLSMGGLGGKAALLLAALAGGPGADSAAALRALLQPADLAALVHVALLASHAQDLVRQLVRLSGWGSRPTNRDGGC
jgi:hypothetical protein